MADDWSSWGLDLHLRLDRSRGLRIGLENALRDAVRSGRLAAGTRLPSSRTLARDLGVARGTVTQALDQLVAEGYLTSAPRSGIRVAAQPAPPPRAAPVTRSWLPPVTGTDLRPGLPDLSAFPRRAWLAATRRVLQTAPNSAFGYADVAGTADLREALAAYLGRARGVVTTPEQIVVCAGYTHALRVVCEALGTASIAFEDPCSPDHPMLAAHLGLTAERLPTDASGLLIDALTGQDAVVVTPAHQYPLGGTLSPDRRTALLAWARRTGAFVLEDDYDGEFRYDRQPVGALQGMAPDQVIYAGTASKTIAPGLRLAWLAVPPALLPALRRASAWDDSSVNSLDQLVLADLVRSGELDRHLRRCRSRYRRRRDRLGEAVARRLPGAHLSGIAAGLHAVLHVPGADERALVARLRSRDVHVDGLTSYYEVPERSPGGLVIGYATPPEHAFASALSALVTALDTR
ncbi:PLP-dependent aminotransferase family protein [Actinomadura kijaniata]|uniref:MocR-like pyridoxine biosynthesis transcription factor PdxR n=1 Tax=Actinomadura kijaniata TaxID=46161 RepID=UPI003F199D15